MGEEKDLGLRQEPDADTGVQITFGTAIIPVFPRVRKVAGYVTDTAFSGRCKYYLTATDYSPKRYNYGNPLST